MIYTIHFRLASDATFGRGDGVAGIVDREVEHDQYGLPYLRGRTLKGLLREEADNLLYALSAMEKNVAAWETVRDSLFGQGGSLAETTAVLRWGHAQLPEGLRQAVIQSLKGQDNPLGRQEVLHSLTALRRQTAVDPTGLPADGSLRTMRVILRQTPFVSVCTANKKLEHVEEGFLAAAVLGLRRAGTGRNRGRGLLADTDLCKESQSILQDAYNHFVQEAGL